MEKMQAFSLLSTYIRFDEGGAATRIEVTDAFWRDVAAGTRTDLDRGLLVSAFPYTADWATSEMHPAGDEVVYLISGEIDLVLEHADGDQVVPLPPGTAIVVPRGTWHTARVRVPGEGLHITPGAGTQHRPIGGASR
jgi:mannose-6-phosphate isomerase-like protein (cupin superfamily)